MKRIRNPAGEKLVEIPGMYNVRDATARAGLKKVEMPRDKKHYIVYRHVLFDGRIYVGITSQKNPKTRWQGGSGYKDNPYFTNAIKKYGWDAFSHDILFTGLSQDEAKLKEIELIAEYKSNERKYGFNISSGGESRSGISLSEWQIERMVEGKRNKGISKETRRKLSVATKEHWKKEGFIQHMRDINMGSKNPQYGRVRTDAEKLQRGAKRVVKKDMNGNVLETYISLRDASAKSHISRDVISKCCKGIFKQGGGFLWEFIKDS